MMSNRNGNGHEQRRGADGGQQSTDLRVSPTMARLLGALEKGDDVGHFGRLVFAMVARHFMDEDRVVRLLARQPEQDEEQARALLLQVQGRDYCPPRRETLLE